MEMTPQIQADITEAINLIDGVAWQFRNTLPEEVKASEVADDYLQTIKGIARNLGGAVNQLNRVLETFGQDRVAIPEKFTDPE